MKKLISLALAIVMIMCLSTTAFATTAEVPGNYTAEVTGSYVAGYESNGIVYCVDIEWNDLDFTYHAEKGAVWDTETLTYSEIAPAYWEGNGAIKVTNRSNTKISAVPKYTPADGYGDADMTFGTDKLKVASAESGTAQSGTITVTPTGFLPAMDESDTIGTITLTIAQDTDVTIDDVRAYYDMAQSLYQKAETAGLTEENSEHYEKFHKLNNCINYARGYKERWEYYEPLGWEGASYAEWQDDLNSEYDHMLETYNACKDLVE